MKLRLLSATLAILAAHAVLAQTPSTQTPPRAGEPAIQTGRTEWDPKLIKGLKGVKPTFGSTFDFHPTTPTPVFEPNEETGWKGPRLKLTGPAVFTNPPDQSGVNIQAEALLGNFNGIGQTNLSPPDPAMSVGPSHVVVAVNARWAIYDKCGNQIYAVNAGDFLGDPGGFYFDPKVAYDPWRGRWLVMWHYRNDAAQDSRLVLQVSDDNNPEGNWWWYRFNSNTGSGSTLAWCDYADLGYGSSTVYASGNQFRYSGGFQTACFYTWNPTEIYNAQTAFTIKDTGLTNPDGSTCFGPRAVRHLNVYFGGAQFVNSRAGGGDKVTVWDITDPLGAHTIAKRDITVGTYAAPPDARQPNSSLLDTIDSRLMPATLVSANSTWQLFTSLTRDNPSEPGNASAFLLNLNPAGSVNWSWNFWASGTSSWFASPAVNYNGTCVWAFSRSGTSLQQQARYVNYEPSGFPNSSSLHFQSTSNYGTSGVQRWGDYFAGDLDWGDFNNSAPSQKLWFYHQYVGGSSSWATRVGSTVSAGVAPGVMSVTPGTGLTFTAFRGEFNNSTNYSVNHASGQVGFAWEASTPTWLSATPNGGIQYPGSSRNVNVATTANANTLAYGIYNSNVVFTNCDGGATATRSARLIVKDRALPSSITVRLGRQQSGNVNSIRARDTNYLVVCKFIVPNLVVPPVQVEINGTAPGSSASALSFLIRGAMVNTGSFSQRLDMFNFVTNAFDVTDFRNDTWTTTFQEVTLNATGSIGRYIGAGNAVRARYQIRQTGPASVNLWCNRTDYAEWQFTP
ncbi:MAG: hypothetical protein KIT11_00375 [Fimbriimonadaceae bacterium]|nr:hypothetical protein [Fimbriimonadaceae bacterium]QYK55172.1 MAG: hypothetical protein KF733_09160 [Fimbriimonadaceae bacterium]